MMSIKSQTLIFVFCSHLACSNPPKARAPERVSSENQFVEICEKRQGNLEEHKSVDAIKLWFEKEFASEISCQEIWEIYNTSNSPLPIGIRSNQLTDISLFSYLPHIVSLNLETEGVLDWSALAGLTKLESLRIKDSKLKSLPETISGKHLKKLVIDSSPIESFEILEQISSLEEVIFENMQLSSIPRELEVSKELTRLHLKATKVDSYQSLAKLTSLISLSITDAELEQVPASLQDLSLLSFLDLSGNLLAREDSLLSLASNQSIRELNLANSNLKKVALSSMGALQILDLSANPQLAESSAIEAFSPSIEGLKLSGNGLSQIPSAITQLEELFALDISNNQIADLNPLANLRRLEIISVEGNPVSEQTNPSNCPIDSESLALSELCSILSQ